jgi:ligand-binding sensor domain-containing protein
MAYREYSVWAAAVACIAVFALPRVDAAEPATTFTHLSGEHGLPSPTVWAVTQDTQGYMWFGTSSGLARYDGLEMFVYRHDPQDPLSLVRFGSGQQPGYRVMTQAPIRLIVLFTIPLTLTRSRATWSLHWPKAGTARSGLVPTGSIVSTRSQDV